MLCCLCLSACLDMITDKCSQITGRIFVTRSDGETVYGYNLVFADTGFSCSNGGNAQPIIDDPAFSVTGNDSVLYVAGVDRTDTSYYSIRHLHGDTILKSTPITRAEFSAKRTDTKYRWRVPD